jgi:hypothetical protein
MPPKPDFDEHDYLAERLRQTQDVASFTGHQSPGGDVAGQPSSGSVVERVTELRGDAHLGGRKVRDRFVRSGGVLVPQAAPAASPKLDPYLEARLKEVQDQAPRFKSVKPTLNDEALDTYRALRRQLGGEP